MRQTVLRRGKGSVVNRSSSTAWIGSLRWTDSPVYWESIAREAVLRCADAAARVAVQRKMTLDFEVDAAATAAAFGAVERVAHRLGRPTIFAPWSRFFRCDDGWVRMHGNYPHHAQILADLFDASVAAPPDDVVKNERASDVEAAIVAHGAAAAAVREPFDWARSAAGRAVAQGPLIRHEHDGKTLELPESGGELLSGIRIVDLTRSVAGPVCTAILSSLGAKVTRIVPPHLPEDELCDRALNQGKENLSYDLADTAVAAQVHQLLGRADAVVLGYRPGSLAAFGLNPPRLRQRYPTLTIASISAWGEDGPWGDRRGFDSVVQAAIGIATSCSEPDGSPGRLPVQALDHTAGFLIAASILESLAERESVGARTAAVNLARVGVEMLEPVDLPGIDEVAAPPARSDWLLPIHVH